jgi:hypothetical protein
MNMVIKGRPNNYLSLSEEVCCVELLCFLTLGVAGQNRERERIDSLGLDSRTS